MLHPEYILTLSCPDKIGIVASVSGLLAQQGLNILELAQFSDTTTGKFFMRVDFRVEGEAVGGKEIASVFGPVAQKFGMTFEVHDKTYRPKVLMMVSKQSHCLNDLLHRQSIGTLPIEIPAIVSNHQDLKAMASWYQIPYHHLPTLGDNQLLDLVETLGVNLVVLARYMQVMSIQVCEQLRGKMINIHHSFLPSFKGAKPYHQAYERGVKLIGATAHYVTSELDEGPIIDQETVRVRHDHAPGDLVKLGCDIECIVLARAIKYHIEQRVFLNGHKTVVFC